jgi:glutamate-1-semialdehyde 2,1-aminomutase
MNTERSRELFERAAGVIPGGVNSPARAFRAVGGGPRFIARGEGAYLVDVDGNRYIDLIGSWGPLLFGHRPPRVVEAITRQLAIGATYGAPTELEIEMAEAIRDAIPSVEKVRLVSSGTEATMSAIRVARGFTGRPKIVKFEGCYHGHADCLLAKAGSGVATLGLPDSAGVPPNLTAETITAPFNDVPAVERIFAEMGDEIACVILEPVVGNSGCIPPARGYLQAMRDLTARHGAVLIFDEVMTGFRLARGGAQALFGVTPDMTTLGKVVGGGLPLAAYGGRREIMDCVAPVGPVYQAGTLSGNPLAVAAGLETLRMIAEDPGVYARLDARGERIANGLRAAAESAGVPVTVNRVGSMLTVFFAADPVTDYATAKRSDTARFAAFHRAMLEHGVYLPPSQFETAFLSDALSTADEEQIAAAAREAFAAARH